MERSVIKRVETPQSARTPLLLPMLTVDAPCKRKTQEMMTRKREGGGGNYLKPYARRLAASAPMLASSSSLKTRKPKPILRFPNDASRFARHEPEPSTASTSFCVVLTLAMAILS